MTDSESAHISLPADSEYLVRITTNDSPGSYPIVINTRNQFRNLFLLKPDETLNSFQIFIYVIFPLVIIFSCLVCCLEFVLCMWREQCRKSSSKSNKMSILEKGYLKIKKSAQKQRESHICQVHQNIPKLTTNANSQKMKANSPVINANKSTTEKQTCKI